MEGGRGKVIKQDMTPDSQRRDFKVSLELIYKKEERDNRRLDNFWDG
jgi:hypothetical protein